MKDCIFDVEAILQEHEQQLLLLQLEPEPAKESKEQITQIEQQKTQFKVFNK